MATPSITQTEFQAIVNGMVHQKFSQTASPQVIMNRAVRYVINDIDLRSAKRKATLSPNMYANVYDYGAPTDLKGEKIIDLRKQVNRDSFERWTLVDEADFDRRKSLSQYRIAVRDENFSKLLRIDGVTGSKSKVLHSCESLTANGTWAASEDASNLTLDNDNYITGGGALNFDMAAGATTGVIENTGMTAVDLTAHDEIGSIFVWVFIPDYSDAQGDTVTNFILRWGNDSSNYWSRTVTTNNEGVTFYDGWNLLRFDWNGATETGTVVPASIDYLRLTVTKSTSLAADTDWRVDDFVSQVGDIYDVIYYSKYGWQTSALAYIEESTTSTDLLLADTDEIEMVAFKAAEFASQELKELTEVPYFKGEYENAKRVYESDAPSEALKKTRNYGGLPRITR
mgnify:CR=1 FL=1